MAEYRVKGLFEAMKASKGTGQHPATPAISRPQVPAGPSWWSRTGDALGRAGRGFGRVVTGRTFLMVVAVIVVALGLVWGGKTLFSHVGNWTASGREKPSVETVARQSVDEHLAGPSAPAVPVVPAVSQTPARTVAVPERPSNAVVPQTAEVSPVGNSAAGAWRIRIFQEPLRSHDEVEKKRRKLDAAGVETVEEVRGTWYNVYTVESFATADGEAAAEALKKVKALGFGTAFATRKPTGKR